MAERILIVEDEKLLRWALRERLAKEGYDVVEAASGAAGKRAVEEESPDLVLLDFRLPDMTGLDVLKDVVDRRQDIPVILMTAYSTVETAVEAIKLGAFDYINKPFNQEEMILLIAKALETSRLRREVRAMRRQQEEQYGLTNIVGSSQAMREVFRMIHKVGRSAASTVLITGESGTGKDLVAKAIHYASDRAGGPFMNITCTALPENLLESELMGHERGAFTDAKTSKQGLFELASGGSIFLDEVGDMGILLQAKLLRFLEEKTFKRVGGVRDLKVDVRVIAATNRDLAKAVKEGRFREDLYYRLKVVPIVLPPLRDRVEDLDALVRHFIDQFNREFKKSCRGATGGAMELLRRHPWPGNVRELRNIIERAMILEDKELLDEDDLPEELRAVPVSRPSAAATDGDGAFKLPEGGYPLDRMEEEMVRQALTRTAGNQTRAARLLGISRDALRYKIKKFQL
ncbi:MAG TPA: sigma-54 dependent transcriptional regulator [Candidatus Polarisedimenticolia bacterium]|nr:sigma-54 dependent transcriptional regulator [Candidatus Polarisedimenticolia bacterium]